MDLDPDPELRPRATTPVVTFTSGGETVFGVLHVPAGPGPHPVALVLHGFPGYERNFDLAQVLRRAGCASLVFHYRGSWGVGGDWSWTHTLEDAARVARGVRDPGLVAEHRLDPGRVAVVGHSFGGFTALMTAAADPEIRAVASISGFDAGKVALVCKDNAGLRAHWTGLFDQWLLPLRGTSGAALMDELIDAGERWSLTGLAARLRRRPVLLIGTSEDDVTPSGEFHDPLVEAYRDACLEHHVFAADHSLSDHRVALSRTVTEFVTRQLGPARDR